MRVSNIKKVIVLLFVVLNLSSYICAAGKKTMYVSVDTAIVRENSSKASKKSASIPYGAAVTIIQEKKDWYYISCDSPKVYGWVQASSLTRKNVAARGKVSSADAKEIALAGKGFNASIETAYAEAGNIDFSTVNKVETYTPSEESIVKFIKEGELNLSEE
ncbi:MAG: SH3 domain-containing protein [Treponema sp.]|nr:SH3 domain-containing protein [Treponema sp.]